MTTSSSACGPAPRPTSSACAASTASSRPTSRSTSTCPTPCSGGTATAPRRSANWWQEQGLRVVPTLSWAQRRSFRFAFDGVPRRSTVAVSTVGVKGDEGALAVWREGMAEAMSRLEPARVLLYGGDIGFDFGGCEVFEYKGGGFRGRQGRQQRVERR